MKVAIIGGGAAGFFASIQVKENYPDSHVVIFEKSQKVLAKVKLSGGGRCNLTNALVPIKEFAKAYPRGEMLMRKALGVFNNYDAMQWFENKGVSLVTQTDNCVFPLSQNSQTIIDCFLQEALRHNIEIRTGNTIKNLQEVKDGIAIETASGFKTFDKLIVATGGSPQRKGLEWLEDLGHTIQNPVPSLFTFNMPTENIKKLMGIVVKNTLVRVQATKFETQGALLITHWGMSGPVVLKLSAYAARLLSEKNYDFSVQVNWLGEKNHERVFSVLTEIVTKHTKKKLESIRPFGLQTRLWQYLIEKAGVSPEKKWGELGKKQQYKLVEILTNDVYKVSGKTTFKEEFVTCGGVSLDSINTKTMQSKHISNLYFAGEVLDIDGITGGFNFQAAWTTGFIAAKLQ